MNRPQVPTIGRVVHYLSYGTPVREDRSQDYPSECRAAMITDVGGEELPGWWVLSLAVFSPDGIFLSRVTTYDPSGTRGGTWHWPELAPEPEPSDGAR